eukprot:TRINITY_DN21218_c0_g1_i1.p1 TRINITY_DN21218_c0_g1~~TRINITY_DN21218_c0_g1_i1.p1  ORF type:complete len:171 (+),score=45.19 TRINITY_DN21218_c0_g1_i1:70-513(+)
MPSIQTFIDVIVLGYAALGMGAVFWFSSACVATNCSAELHQLPVEGQDVHLQPMQDVHPQPMPGKKEEDDEDFGVAWVKHHRLPGAPPIAPIATCSPTSQQQSTMVECHIIDWQQMFVPCAWAFIHVFNAVILALSWRFARDQFADF